VFVHYPTLDDSCVCNLFIEYDFDFFEKIWVMVIMNIFYSMIAKGI
jgi:hypothetical protein